MTTIISGTGSIIRPIRPDEFDFAITLHESQVVVSQATTLPVTIEDASALQSTDSVVQNEFSVSIQQINGGASDYVIEASNGSVENGVVAWFSNGNCVISARHPWLTKAIRVQFLRAGGQISNTLQNYLPGSLAKNISERIESMIVGKNSSHLSVFSTINHSAGTYIRNTDCWALSADFTCVSPWNSGSGSNRAGVLVSPKHFMFATHASIGNGWVMRFVAEDNSVIERTVVSSSAVTGYDCSVGVLDNDIPASIRFAKVMPSNFEDFLPTHAVFQVPVISFDQESKAVIKRIHTVTSGVSPSFLIVLVNATGSFASFTEQMIAGDSGSPSFAIVNNETVLLTTWTTATNGPAIHKMHQTINAAMTALGGGYQLSVADLSSFTNYN